MRKQDRGQRGSRKMPPAQLICNANLYQNTPTSVLAQSFFHAPYNILTHTLPLIFSSDALASILYFASLCLSLASWRTFICFFLYFSSSLSFISLTHFASLFLSFCPLSPSFCFYLLLSLSVSLYFFIFLLTIYLSPPRAVYFLFRVLGQ